MPSHLKRGLQKKRLWPFAKQTSFKHPRVSLSPFCSVFTDNKSCSLQDHQQNKNTEPIAYICALTRNYRINQPIKRKRTLFITSCLLWCVKVGVYNKNEKSLNIVDQCVLFGWFQRSKSEPHFQWKTTVSDPFEWFDSFVFVVGTVFLKRDLVWGRTQVIKFRER